MRRRVLIGALVLATGCTHAQAPKARLAGEILATPGISDGYQAQLRALNQALTESNGKLAAALSEVRTLWGFIPMCSRCKKMRDDEGYWEDVENYLRRNSEAVVSLGKCPACARSDEQDAVIKRIRPARPEAEPPVNLSDEYNKSDLKYLPISI